MVRTGISALEAEHAFDRARRARVRALLRRRSDARRLPVLEPRALTAPAQVTTGVREIPLSEIRGTLEPGRAHLFDRAFRPAAAVVRCRWLRLWLAEHRGVLLPPVSLVRVGHAYAVQDGHHRISVARARGALAIDATVAHLVA